MIRPLPDTQGVGFTSMQPLEGMEGYRYENVGRFHNYHFTSLNFKWPVPFVDKESVKIDGFSPNLNKELHVGHLRNMALANAFSKLHPKWEFVAILGTSLGLFDWAFKELNEWFDFLEYKPSMYYDVMMPWDVVKRRKGTGKNAGAQVWISPTNEEIVVMRSNLLQYKCTNHVTDEIRSFYLKEDEIVEICPFCGRQSKSYMANVFGVDRTDSPAEKAFPNCLDVGKTVIQGRPNYVFHDLSFAATIAPDYYITGVEQIEHFKALGLGDKHLPMGLVLGADGKKLKSRTNDALTATEAMEMVQSRLDKTIDPKKLAWNIVAWNFLHVNRSQNVRFDPEKWTSPESPGLYISYTYARLYSALKKALKVEDHPCHWTGETSWYGFALSVTTKGGLPDVTENLTDVDIRILGYAEYANHWRARSLESMDTAPLANYVHDLCMVLTKAYNTEQIVNGRKAFQAALIIGMFNLRNCMEQLGMFVLKEV